jgi:protein-S-isoprenylcysteine O-methyltransferase Ste14
MNRISTFAYGVASYAAFLAVFVYAIGFIGGFWTPTTLDGAPRMSLLAALGIDLGLLTAFALQHSGMARPAFKRWWTRIVPPAVERSTYVLASSLVLVLLYWQWRPLPTVVWDVGGAGYWALFAISALGWLLVLASTFLINHFDLFGLRQVWAYARERKLADQPFVARAFYRMVRHPLMLGFLIAFWATPHMTAGHLLFAAVTTAYILVAVKFLEERDLLAQHGDAYRAYQREVPMIVPRPWHRRGEAPAARAMSQRRPAA